VSLEDRRCDRCGASGRELRRHVLEAIACPHCVRGENVEHRPQVLAAEDICRDCFDAIRNARMAALKAQAVETVPVAQGPLEGDEVPF
jgi:hypothetical protein